MDTRLSGLWRRAFKSGAVLCQCRVSQADAAVYANPLSTACLVCCRTERFCLGFWILTGFGILCIECKWIPWHLLRSGRRQGSSNLKHLHIPTCRYMLCVYICMYIHIHICIYACAIRRYVCKYVCMYAWCTCAHTYAITTNIYVYTHMHV